MKLLVAPVHHFISDKSAPQASRAFGSEYGRAYDYLLHVSKDKNISGDAIVGYSDLTSMGNIKIHSLYKKPLVYVSIVSRLVFPFRVLLKSLRLMINNKYDCIWHLGPFGFNKTFNLLGILKLQNAKFVVGPILTPLNIKNIHGKEKVSITKKIDGFIYDKLSNIFKHLSFVTLKRADAIVVVEGEGLAILTKLGINNGTVLHLGISDTRFESKPRSLRSGIINLLYAGYLVDRKRVEDIVTAVNYLVNKHNIKNIRLTIVGDGPTKNNLISLISKFNINKYVFMLGQVDRAKVFSLYQKANLFVTGSVLESMPNMYFEAMSSALPMVIAENISAIELKKDGFGGIVVEGENPIKMARAIAKIIKSKKLYHEMSTKNYNLSKTKYNFEKEITKLKNILNNNEN